MRNLLALVWVSIFFAACGSEQQQSLPEKPGKIDTIVAHLPANKDTIPETPPPPLSEYEQIFLDSGLVNIHDLDPSILVDLKYSTEDNFIKADVYGDLVNCYLRDVAAEKLADAQARLKKLHPDYSLLVFDGARPRRVQYKMWELLDVPYKRNYLAPPQKGSVHNYGCAVDLSIADVDGQELDMGTPFDFFGPLAQPQLEARFTKSGELTDEQLANRKLLRKVMLDAGFFNIRTEWWHFNALPSKEVEARYRMIE